VEPRIFWEPRSTLRELRDAAESTDWWAHELLILLFLLSCTVSALASGRLTARLIVDGAVSFAFVPIVEIASFAFVYRVLKTQLTFERVATLFLVGNAPWFAWLVSVAAASAFVRPAYWPPWWLPATMCPVALWSAYIDFCFFTEVLHRSPFGAVRDLIVFRAIAWTAATIYFFGIAVWFETLPELRAWIGL
jgi:hypothetical protein